MAKAKALSLFRFRLFHALFQRGGCGKQLFSPLIERPARLGQGEAAAVSHRKRDAQLPLQLCDGAADGGVAFIQPLPRSGEAAGFGQGGKDAKLFEILQKAKTWGISSESL